MYAAHASFVYLFFHGNFRYALIVIHIRHAHVLKPSKHNLLYNRSKLLRCPRAKPESSNYILIRHIKYTQTTREENDIFSNYIWNR